MRTALRRLALYGASVLVLWAGWRLYASLASKAALADDYFAGPEVSSGRLGDERLFDLLVRTGSSAGEAAAVSAAVATVQSPRTLLPGDLYRVERSTAGELRHLTLSHGLKLAVVTPDDDGGFRARSVSVAVHESEHHASGTIKGSLWASMAAKGVPAETIVEFTGVFRWTMDFLTEPRDGDKFAVAWTERRAPDRVLGRTVRAASYDGRVTGRKTGLLFHDAYYDEKGSSLKRRFLRAPLQYSHISDYFTNRRYHPILRIYRPHHGIDYAAPRGTPVAAVADGRVTFAGWRGGFGNAVEIRHDSVYVTLYGHLSRIAAVARHVGARIHQGEIIGRVGSTGLSTGPHLHFQITKNGKYMNFLTLDLPFATSITRRERPAFDALRKKLLAELGG